MVSQEHTNADSPPAAKWLPPLGRLLGWLPRRPRDRLLLALGGATTLGLLLAAWLLVPLVGSAPPPALDHRAALLALEEGNLPRARALALELLAQPEPEYEQLGLPAFVLGAAAAREAEERWDAEEARRLHALAARYLEEAERRGWPAGFELQGRRLLGRSLVRSGEYDRALPVLRGALEMPGAPTLELNQLLAEAALEARPADPAAAAECIEQVLAGELSTVEREAAQLLAARIHLARGEPAAVEAALAEIPDRSRLAGMRRVLAAQARRRQALALEDSAARESLLEETFEQLREAGEQGKFDSGSARRGEYLRGLLLRDLGRLPQAAQQFARVRRQNFDTHESLAAGLEEAEILQQLGRGAEALAAYKLALAEAGGPETFKNPWIELEELRRRTYEAVARYSLAGDHGRAQELAAALAPVHPPDRAVELSAEILETWGKAELAVAADLHGPEAERLREEARARFRQAGAAFEQLAALRYTNRQHPHYLWRASENYLAGRDFRASLAALEAYLVEEPLQRQAEALVRRGELELALGRLEEAKRPLETCLELHPKHPVKYQARLLLGTVLAEMGRFEEARASLEANLADDVLTPQSRERRDSLFALGELLFRMGTRQEAQAGIKAGGELGQVDPQFALPDLERSAEAYGEALLHLEEGALRYPSAPQSLEARYLIAEARRRSARYPRLRLQTVAIETTRRTLRREVDDHLQAALAQYTELQQRLQRKQEQEILSGMEEHVLRNARFGLAHTLFDLERYDDAINAYLAVTNHYHQQPEALEAFMQIASCYRRSNRPAEARGFLQRARVVLSRIPGEADFTRTTRFSRDEWASLLDSMLGAAAAEGV